MEFLKDVFFYAIFGAMFWLILAFIAKGVEFVVVKVQSQRLYKKAIEEKADELKKKGADLEKALQEVTRMRNFYLTSIAPTQPQGNRSIH